MVTIYLLFAIIYILSIAIILVFFLIKIKKLKKDMLPYESVEIISKLIDLSLNQESIINYSKNIVDTLMEYYSVDYCTVFVYKDMLRISASNNHSSVFDKLEEHFNSIIGDMTNFNGKLFETHDKVSALSYPTASDRSIRYAFFIPLEKNKRIIGAILIENINRDSLKEFQTYFFKFVTDKISILLLDLITKDERNTESNTDPLTNIFNKRYMYKFLDKQLSDKKIFTLAILDIDHFKNINDTYGHPFGDIVLKQVAHFIRKSIRASDEIFRFGGEEFVLFFNGSDCRYIYDKLDKIREELSNLKLVHDSGLEINITASFGLSEYPKDADNIIGLIEKADKALYISKDTGRNKITVAS